MNKTGEFCIEYHRPTLMDCLKTVEQEIKESKAEVKILNCRESDDNGEQVYFEVDLEGEQSELNKLIGEDDQLMWDFKKE